MKKQIVELYSEEFYELLNKKGTQYAILLNNAKSFLFVSKKEIMRVCAMSKLSYHIQDAHLSHKRIVFY